MLKKSEKNGTEEIGLVTPTPGMCYHVTFVDKLYAHMVDISLAFKTGCNESQYSQHAV